MIRKATQMTEIKSKFWSDLAEELKDPQFRAEYVRETLRLEVVDALINSLDEKRSLAGLSKAELARVLGSEPANIRRLFTGKSTNPTMASVVDVALALGFELKLVPLSKSKKLALKQALVKQAV